MSTMTSLVNAPSVIFLDILDHYCYNKDLSFKLKFGGDYKVDARDEVVILKLGWSNKSDAIVKQHVEKVSQEGICVMSFKSNDLPREWGCINLYQICYFRGQELQGASSPFDFCDIEIPTSESFVLPSLEMLNRYQSDQGKEHEISRLKEQNASLKEENEILRKSLKVLLNDKLEKQEKGKCCEKQISELKDLFHTLQTTVHANDTDIKMLKKKIVEGGEEYKKLYMEKYKLEKRFDRVVSAFKKQGQSQHNSNCPDEEITFDISTLPSLPQMPSLLSSK